jgi:hypothetical protein
MLRLLLELLRRFSPFFFGKKSGWWVADVLTLMKIGGGMTGSQTCWMSLLVRLLLDVSYGIHPPFTALMDRPS